MTRPVFISYSRRASVADAQALAAKLGGLAFLDTTEIDDGDQFPQCLLDGILDASIVVIFASQAYSERRFCRLEMRLALAGGDASAFHLVLALSDASRAVQTRSPRQRPCHEWKPSHQPHRHRRSPDTPTPPPVNSVVRRWQAARLAGTASLRSSSGYSVLRGWHPDASNLSDICHGGWHTNGLTVTVPR